MKVSEGASIGSRMGHICSLFGLTPRAVRFYEERGLIAPRRDAYNRRIYDETSRRRLQLIAALRRSHLSLPDIQDVLDCPGETQQLELSLAKLNAQKHGLERVLADICTSIGELSIRLPFPLSAQSFSEPVSGLGTYNL